MLLTLFTVCIVLFLYLHVAYHVKTSNDLEIFELENPEKAKLEEVCNLRQPCTFLFWDEAFEALVPENIGYDEFELNVSNEARDLLPLPVSKAKRLFRKSTRHTERNSDFLKETLLCRIYESHDHLLRPPMVSSMTYDLVFGGENATTKLRYTSNFRNFFVVLGGEVTIKLSPPQSSKRLDEVKDYVNMDFYSTIDAWKSSKVKFLELTLTKGQALFVPAYWWHSMKLGKDACVACFYYKTVMSVVATVPSYVIGLVQRQNARIVKNVDLNSSNDA